MKSAYKMHYPHIFDGPKSSFGEHRFGLGSFEKWFEYSFPNVCSAFPKFVWEHNFQPESWLSVLTIAANKKVPCGKQHLCSPNDEFSRVEQSVAYAFLSEFSNSRSQKRVLTPSKSASKTHTQRLFQQYKIFVWGSRRQLVPDFSTISILNAVANKKSRTFAPRTKWGWKT